MKLAYRQVILTNPGFILRRIRRGVRTGELFWDAYYFLKFLFLPAYNRDRSGYAYYAEERWPRIDFKVHLPTVIEYQRAAYKAGRSRTKIAPAIDSAGSAKPQPSQLPSSWEVDVT